MLCRALILTLAVAAVLAGGASTAMADGAGNPGAVNFVRPAESSFDQFTRDGTHAPFMNAKYWRMRTYGPYFDSRLSWYSGAWMYMNAYAIYRGQAVAAAHPEWILKDTRGNKLYIPFGCSNGSCPQYAADIGNPAWRANFIAIAKQKMALGYKGLFIDDVNMWLNVGDGYGRDVAPVDPRTGQEMTETAWRRYFAEFLEQVRAALPTSEIVHNSVWFAPAGPEVDRQIRAADMIEVERGINDSGLTGGNGFWSLRNVLRYVDRIHQLGAGVILDSDADSVADREYGLAGYFLVSTGNDGLGNDTGARPTDWWAGYDADLGAPLGPRYDWQGLLRRDFEHGTVLVNEPDAPTRTVAIDGAMKRVDGSPAGTVTLGESRGAVLLKPSGAQPHLQDPQPEVAPTPEPGESDPAPADAEDVADETEAPEAVVTPAPAASAPRRATRRARTTTAAPRPATKKKPTALRKKVTCTKAKSAKKAKSSRRRKTKTSCKTTRKRSAFTVKNTSRARAEKASKSS